MDSYQQFLKNKDTREHLVTQVTQDSPEADGDVEVEENKEQKEEPWSRPKKQEEQGFLDEIRSESHGVHRNEFNEHYLQTLGSEEYNGWKPDYCFFCAQEDARF